MSENIPNQTQLPPETSSWAMLRTLSIIATMSGLLIAITFKITLPYIEANQHQATEQAIFHVLPKTIKRIDFVINADGLQRAGLGITGDLIYATYDAAGILQGIALLGAARGYADVIKVIYSYRPDCECITGTKILKMTETPGFGDKMNYDLNFLKNFEKLDVRLNASGDKLAHPIVAVKHGSKHEPWQIDALSGATVSSRGMAGALEESAERLLPQIRRHLPELQAAGRSVGAINLR